MPFLRYTNADRKVMHVPLNRDVTVLGRSKDCDIPLDDLQASRCHCEIRKTQGGFILVDLNSKNGTYVNGTPVSTWSLSDGDLIAIGGQQISYRLAK